MAEILKKYGYSSKIIQLKNLIHLKTGIAYIGDNNLILSGELIDNPNFKEYNIIKVDEHEAYAANCLHIKNKVLIAKGFEKLKNSISSIGYNIIEIDMSEFQKMDGGLSCLSIRL